MSAAGAAAIMQGIGSLGSAFRSSGGVSAKRALRHQRFYAENAIRLRVEDAKRAGINPLYALGANVTTPTATYGSVGKDAAAAVGGVGRAIGKYAASKDRAAANEMAREGHYANLAVQEAQAEMYNARAANDIVGAQLKSSQLARDAAALNVTPTRGKPLYEKYYDNRAELGALNRGELFIVAAENPAEGMEGLGALGVTAFGTATGERKPPMGVRFWKYMQPRYRRKKPVKRVLKQRYLPDITIR